MIGGPTEGAVLSPEVYWQMMTEYYTLMGYDPDTSIPRKSTLDELNLEYVAKELINVPE